MIRFRGLHSNAVTDRCASSTKDKCYSKVVRWEKKKRVRQEESIGITKNWSSWIERNLTCWSLDKLKLCEGPKLFFSDLGLVIFFLPSYLFAFLQAQFFWDSFHHKIVSPFKNSSLVLKIAHLLWVLLNHHSKAILKLTSYNGPRKHFSHFCTIIQND